MRNGVLVLLVGITLGYGGVVMARESGGGQHGNPGGMSSGHMSQEGKENTNAQWSSGATKGQDRSDLRRDDNQGHGQNHGKGKGHGQGHEKHKGKGGSGGGSD